MRSAFIHAIWVLVVLLGAVPARAETLESIETTELRRYLAELQAGRPGSAARVDQLADIPFAGVRTTMRTYVNLKAPVAEHSHRAFQALLERTTREAYSPWPMVMLYAPEFAQFLSQPLKDNTLSQQLFDRLRDSGGDRSSFDLAVRLTPEATLTYLAASTRPGRVELLDAWNRRLARGPEKRPVANLEQHLAKIVSAFSPDLPGAELEARLRFVAAWPARRADYRACLDQCLRDPRPAVVLAGLVVQHRAPLLLDKNEAVITRFAEHPKIVERALLNYAFDKKDYAATLDRLWAKLPATQPRARRACLFAMGVHPRGNDGFALAAVLERSYDFIDVASPILKAGDSEKARQAVRHILTRDKRGQEEAFRLARELDLPDFAEDALRIARDERRDQILRQSALLYLQGADGKTRRALLSFLTHPNRDLRLSAIQLFRDKRRLTDADRNDIGPALIRVALHDPSPGHRQEAIFVLGNWREASATEFLRKVLHDHPPAARAGSIDGASYWDYRLRLVALLGLARLGDSAARTELHSLHRSGGPTERMDVLLAFLDLGEVPEFAFTDLSAAEPRLVATAAQLIARHGQPAERARLHKFFRDSPLWSEFVGSGIDDFNILRLSGGVNHGPK